MMHIERLDHVNIATHDLAATREFYVDVIGLRVGERPPFGFAGLWLYDDSVAVIHVTGLESSDPPISSGGAIDHVSFRASGLAKMRERVRQRRIPATEALVPRNGDVQIFLRDPNGVKIELTFAAAEVAQTATLVER